MSELTLHWHEGNQPQTKKVKAGSQLVIGRRSDSDIVIAASTVSRQHALIFSEEGVFMCRNLSQTNPIRVNEHKILGHRETVALNEGDEIQVGPTTFTVALFVLEGTHKIRCINCQKVLDYDPTGFCPWCGMALAAGQTVIDLE